MGDEPEEPTPDQQPDGEGGDGEEPADGGDGAVGGAGDGGGKPAKEDGAAGGGGDGAGDAAVDVGDEGAGAGGTPGVEEPSAEDPKAEGEEPKAEPEEPKAEPEEPKAEPEEPKAEPEEPKAEPEEPKAEPEEKDKPKGGKPKAKRSGTGDGGGGGKAQNTKGPKGSHALKEMQDRVVLPDRVVKDLKRQQRQVDDSDEPGDGGGYTHAGQAGIPKGLAVREQYGYEDADPSRPVVGAPPAGPQICPVCGMDMATAPFCVMTGARHVREASHPRRPPYDNQSAAAAYPVKTAAAAAAAGGCDVVPQHVPAERGAFGMPQAPASPPLTAQALAQRDSTAPVKKKQPSMVSMATTTVPDCPPSARVPDVLPAAPPAGHAAAAAHPDWDRLNAYSSYTTYNPPPASAFAQRTDPAFVLQQYDLPAAGELHEPPPRTAVHARQVSPSRPRPGNTSSLSQRFNDPEALLPSPYTSPPPPGRHATGAGASFPAASTPPQAATTYPYAGRGPLPSEIVHSASRGAPAPTGRGPLPSEAFPTHPSVRRGAAAFPHGASPARTTLL